MVSMTGRQGLLGSKQPVSGITQTRDDIGILVEM
jgi:hypothetical protein